MNDKEFAREIRSRFTEEEIDEFLRVPCCHITGMHNPVHEGICDFQKSEAYERIVQFLSIYPNREPLVESVCEAAEGYETWCQIDERKGRPRNWRMMK